MTQPVNSYYIGQRVRLWANFYRAGVLVDPTEIYIMNRDPSGNEATEQYIGGAGAVVKAATGQYYLDLTLDEEGDWYWRVESTVVITAGERRMHVYTSNFDTP